MKSVALAVVALGLLFTMAAPSWAHGPGHYHHYVHAGAHFYGACPTVVVTPAPVYGYASYPPVVAPAVAPVVTTVAPNPYYYYGAPGVTLGYRGPGVRLGVRF